MTMTVATMLLFASVIFVATSKPGPGVLAVVSRSLADGWKQGAAVAAGTCTMHIAYMVLVSLTVTIIQEQIEFLGILLMALGATYMIYLGAKELEKINRPVIVTEAANHRRDLFNNYMTGFITALSNPLVILLYAGIVPNVVNIQTMTFGDILVCALIVAVANGGTLFAMSVGASKVRRFLIDGGNARGLRIVVAAMFILIGIFLGISALPLMDWNHIYFGGKA